MNLPIVTLWWSPMGLSAPWTAQWQPTVKRTTFENVRWQIDGRSDRMIDKNVLCMMWFTLHHDDSLHKQAFAHIRAHLFWSFWNLRIASADAKASTRKYKKKTVSKQWHDEKNNNVLFQSVNYWYFIYTSIWLKLEAKEGNSVSPGPWTTAKMPARASPPSQRH